MKISLMRSALVAGFALAAGAAQAATTVTSVNGPDTPQSNVLFDFNGPTPGLSGNFALVTGTVQGQYAAPLLDTTQYLVVPGTGSSGTALLDLGGSYDNLSFYWGSIDDYNTVEFFSNANGTGSIFSITGNNVPNAPANGSQGSALNNRRVFFDFGTDSVASIRFSSSQIAFELDDIASVVPEPTVWMTMIAGFGLVGMAVRRRRTAVVAA